MVGGCGQFIIEPDSGYERKEADVNCSMGQWPFWYGLRGERVYALGYDDWRDSCRIPGIGGWVFCVQDVMVLETPVELQSWSAVKSLYR